MWPCHDITSQTKRGYIMTTLAHNLYSGNDHQLDNYKFLAQSFPELYRVSQEAEQYYSIDHACCLLKARLFIELWCHEVADKINLYPALHGDLMDKIELLSVSQQIPPYIIEALHNVRCLGNRGVHITKCIDGQWSCNASIAKSKLRDLMIDIFELSQYLAFKLNLQKVEQQSWHEPSEIEFAGQVYAALAGNKEAAFELAQRTSSEMELVELDTYISNLEKKQHWETLQRDLNYWLEKAHRQSHQGTWLMYANVYLKKQLLLPQGQTIDNCFKLALKTDHAGDVAFQYGSYLITRSQQARGIELITQAGEQANHKAIRVLQQKYYSEDIKQYHYWIEAGLHAEEKRSFTLDLFEKLKQWELDKNNDILKKKVKTALISAKARLSPAVNYFSGYCDYHGYWGNAPAPVKGLSAMIKHHQQVPQFIDYQEILFNIVKKDSEYTSEAIELANDALRINKTVLGKAQIKFELAMLIWRKLQNGNKVKSPHALKQLIRESAKAGHVEAIDFIKSPKGKVILRDGSIISTKSAHIKVDRKKQKQANKAARKAKRS
ncbi:MAG: hypothetical protein ACJAS1_003101 [Oleiphilaceae bacterium]